MIYYAATLSFNGLAVTSFFDSASDKGCFSRANESVWRSPAFKSSGCIRFCCRQVSLHIHGVPFCVPLVGVNRL